MLLKIVLCLATLHFWSVAAQGECTDFRGRIIFNGMHYVPGPDTCTLCVCDNGLPKVCKAVLCSPPQDCRSFRVGNTCCEFICLDDVVKPVETAEANIRVAAGGAAALLLLTVALVVYRVRRHKRRRAPHADDQRSLTSIGYISGSMGYMGGTCETALGAWKPPGNYLPRGEAPPPYDEAVAQCRPDAVRMGNETQFHRTFPATVETVAHPEEPVQCAGHAYVNIPRPVQQIPNTQNCYNAPLLQPVHPQESREANSMPHHPLANEGVNYPVLGFPSAIRLTGSLGAISNRALLAVAPRDREPERPPHVPGFYAAPHALHRTIPRIATATGAVGPGAALEACFPRAGAGGRALSASAAGAAGAAGEVRRSFHRAARPPPPAAGPAAHRSVPRHLDRAPEHAAPLVRLIGGRSRAHSEERNVGAEESPERASPPPPSPAPIGPSPAAAPVVAHSPLPAPALAPFSASAPSSASATATASASASAPASASLATTAPATVPAPVAAPTAPAPHATLPLTVDKPSCVCSYEGSNAPGAEDADDYRSECENCKSASSSRWVLDGEWSPEEGGGTQTLQRRAPPAPPPPPATATLPQPVTRQSRALLGPPSNWENWFNTIPDSDTDSEEE